MITERELLDAIRECEADPVTPSKVGKLADLYTIYDHLYGGLEFVGTSHSVPPVVDAAPSDVLYTNGTSDFLRSVDGRKSAPVWRILDELMDVVRTLHPKMYDAVLDKLTDV